MPRADRSKGGRPPFDHVLMFKVRILQTQTHLSVTSAPSSSLLRQRRLKSPIHRKKPAGQPMPERTARANAEKSAVRAPIEHVFAEQKARMGLSVRTIGLARATTRIGLANLGHNRRRRLWLERQPGLA